jgi:hypothetical protein
MAVPAKATITVNGSINLVPDKISYGYPQTDGEGSGATDENRMFREVLPERDTLKLLFSYPSEAVAQKLMQVRALVDCSVNFYDLRSRSRVTKTMYPVGDDLVTHALLSGEFIFEPYELRFVQMIPNG